MRKWYYCTAVVLLTIVVLTSCSAPPPAPSSSISPTAQSSTVSPTPSPTETSPSPTQTTPSPSPSPQPSSSSSPTQQPPAQMPGFPLYPGATQTTKVTTDGEGPDSQKGTVTYISLETTDSFEQVKAFYEGQVPSGWKKTGSYENTDDKGDRTYTLSTESGDGKAWFILSVMESKADGKVTISHNVGAEGSAQNQPVNTGDLKPYPNATVVSNSSWTGMGGNGQNGTWTAVTLQSTDPYEQVKAYYEGNQPAGYSSTYSGENTDDNGARTYSAWLASADQKKFYMVGVTENKDENKVDISQTFGTSE